MRVLTVVFIVVSSLIGCAAQPTSGIVASPEGSAARPVAKKTFNAQIGIVNHTDRYIYSAGVDGEGGGHADEFSAGSANICCATLPIEWHRGLKVLVTWDMPEGYNHVRKRKIVEVERYESPGDVYLHFFPSDQVRVVITRWVGWAPQHPIAPPLQTSREPK